MSNNNNNSTPSRGNTALFNADLFSTPTGLSSLSDHDLFSSGNSPFILTPVPAAVSVSDNTTSRDNSEETFSTIPLDSPVQQDNTTLTTSSSQSVSTSGSIQSITSQSVNTAAAGWNDPPFLSHPPPPPSVSMSTAQRSLSQPLIASSDNDHIVQPHILQRESPRPSTSEGSVNPYRITTTGKKPTPYTTASNTLQTPPISQLAAPPTGPPTGPPTSVYSMTTPPVVGGVTTPPVLGGDSSVIPVQAHWFYLRSNEQYWFPFSIIDSNKLEEIFLRINADPSNNNYIVQTDGGRYDVNVKERQRHSVYWIEPVANVRRCTWFYKGEQDKWYLPYMEDISDKLENAFNTAIIKGQWNTRIDLPQGDAVIIHSPTVMSHYTAQQVQPFNHEIDYRPKTVLRGFVERGKVEMGEDRTIDHLVFVVHGIGPFADIRLNKFRSLIDCVDDFREVSQLMLRTHKFSGNIINKGRVEYLPVHWHDALHGDDIGVDNQVRSITLPSISMLRDFTNTTLMDILFYTSPLYLQTIIDTVSTEMNRMLELFKTRNPSFNGEIAVMGHSLGSCILFDLLYHQGGNNITSPTVSSTIVTPSHTSLITDETTPTLIDTLTQLGLPQLEELFNNEMIDFDSLMMCSNDDLKDIGVPLGARKKLSNYIEEWNKNREIEQERKIREAEEKLAQELTVQSEGEIVSVQSVIEGVQYVKGVAGTGQPLVNYPSLNFNPSCLFALGSPIALFLTLRGVESLGPEYKLPTCSAVYNIFHPYDPVAYRLEPLINSQCPVKPVLMPHHKGRKRFHLEIYDNIEKMSISVKHHVVEGIRNMWNQLNELARAHTTTTTSTNTVDTTDTDVEVSSQVSSEEYMAPIGTLSDGNRIDYVLQEKPIETINEYLFALSSHLCYWRSEDTALFILKQLYKDQKPQLIKS